MWKAIKTEPRQEITQYRISEADRHIAFRDFIDLLQGSTEFIRFFTKCLRDSLYNAYFWEVKPVIEDTVDESLEFVLIQSFGLMKMRADCSAFSEHFTGDDAVVSFPNLGGDAMLVAPNDISIPQNYSHLASFVRNAPEEQVEEFWKAVGREYQNALGNAPRWLSTAGFGVPWLHVRIDSWPKYYRYEPYRQIG